MHPSKILFHPFKHHLATINAFITSHQGQLPQHIQTVKTLGASQFDCYTGMLTVEELEAQTGEQLRLLHIHTKEEYAAWIAEHDGYREITLSDGATWTLRMIDKPNFVHLHPSRYAKHTVRVKANAMKTLVCCMMMEAAATLDIERLNFYRANFLQLPPLVEQGNHEEILKVYALLKRALP
ncbi:hypothetical protein LX64_05055 [Chitinophaga skermanii]|uniref:Uncharacterized protein n=1 Tax=Chitinophaga skermanii TaxID=331697 RepID=A0A327Q1B8_9BACT|nr:hypothetical protein [Chitinophaga skermanii]RAI97547.1 hypothetical protein LX64_05055 [Chitinophaga skermanii]